MAEYVSAYLLKVDELGDVGPCPGEAKCTIIKTPGLENIEVTCPACKQYPTKEGTEPPEVRAALLFTNRHEKRVEAGLRVRTDDLYPLQWAALEGLQLGRAIYEQEKPKPNGQ